MILLHTSDWHLGRSLYGRKRYEEFEAFLDWLVGTIREQGADALLVAGDVFDNSTPSNRAQELYYRFLCRVADSPCRHVVVTAGNHDSPSFLDAPRALLRALNVHVVGSASATPEEELLVLEGAGGEPELLVCAVPYLRDRDIRSAEAGETVEDKAQKLTEGITEHYRAVGAAAEAKRGDLGGDIPIVGMGHLFTAGGRTQEDDGVRDLYVGSLGHVEAGIFPTCFDYLALGHLHVPQKVGGREDFRYSGSPLPMGFGEAGQRKSVCRVAFEGREPTVELCEVPVFQQLERVRGDWDALSGRIRELAKGDSNAWLELVHDGQEILGDLRERLEELVSGTQMEILRVKDNRIIDRVLGQMHEEETLDELDVKEVFERCLDAHQIPEEQRDPLLQTYAEALRSHYENDARAE